MRFGSLFAGIGGFDLGLERAGMTCAWQCEADPKARAVLRRHWPDVPIYEDVREMRGGDVEAVDLVCGGFPCQDISVAGRRAGLAGKRSGLFYEFVRLARELAPRWILLENVPSLLSSNGGRDMGAVLGALGQLGYGWTYRVLDSQYFGVAQRRSRVFLVGRAGGACPPEVLFEPEVLPWDLAPRAQAGADAAPGDGEGARGEGVVYRKAQRAHHSEDCERWEETDRADTLDAGGHTARTATVALHRVAHTLTAEGHDASEDGTGRGVPVVAQPVAYALTAREGKGPSTEATSGNVVATYQATDYRTGAYERVDQAVANALMTGGKGGGRSCDRLVWDGLVPRKLTPRECERVQGFPDDWTAEGVVDGEPVAIADSPRYRTLGNAVTVPVAEWIGRRILRAHQEATR